MTPQAEMIALKRNAQQHDQGASLTSILFSFFSFSPFCQLFLEFLA